MVIFATIGMVGIFVLLRRLPIVAFFLASFTFLPYLSMTWGDFRSGYLVIVFVCFALLVIAMQTSCFIVSTLKVRLNIALVVFTLWIYVTSISNVNSITNDSLAFIAIWSVIVIFYVLAGVLFRRMSLVRIRIEGDLVVKAIIFCGAMSCLIALLEQFEPNAVHQLYSPAVLDENIWGGRTVVSESLSLKRAGSIIGSPNAFGAFLVISLVAVLIKTNVRTFVVSVPLLMLLSVGLVFSNSRGAMLGFAVAATIYLWVYGHRWLLSIGIGISAVLVAVGMLSTLTQSAYIPEKASMELGGMMFLPDFLLERAYFWSFVLSSVFNGDVHLLIGYGVSNNVLAEAIEKKGAHSLIFSSLHFYGVIGLLLAINILRIFSRTISQSMKFTRGYWAAETAFYSGVGLLVHSLVDDILLSNTAVMAIFMVLLLPVNALVRAQTKHINQNPGEVLR